MTSPPVLDDAAFEAELRAMLARRAGDVRPARPPAPAARPTGPRATRPRGWALLAAAAAVVVVAGAAIARAGGDGADRTTTGPSSPGGEGVPDAGVVWPVVGEEALAQLVADPGDLASTLAAPDSAAAAYLAEYAPGATPGEAVTDDGREAVVPWSSGDDYRGRVELRDAGGPAAPLWVVAGSTTDGLSVVDVRAENGGLSFAVDCTFDLRGAGLAIRARVDGLDAAVQAPGGGAGGPLALFVPAPGGADVDIVVRAGDEPYRVVTHVGFRLPEGAAPEPEVTPPTPDLAPTGGTAPSEPTEAAAETLAGTYEGHETFVRVTGGACDLDHVLDLTLTPAAGEPWTLHATYCGVLDGEQRWRGEGPVVITTAAGDTLTGWLDSAADLPTDGEPFTVEVTGGTGVYDGAGGTCRFDNHLVATGPGSQDQFGDWSCSVTP